MNSKKNMKFFAQGVLGELSKKDDKERLRDLIIITFVRLPCSKSPT